MKISLNLPVVVQQPGIASAWEADGTIEDLALIAKAAEDAGYFHITCSEHVGITTQAAEAGRGTTYWDPLATFGYLAARTSSIRLATNILVLGYHHPLAVAKRYGTLDRVSNGRLILGVGVGTLKEEFDLLGAPFDDRGARADEAMAALAASFGRRQPAFEGRYYRYDNFVVDPHGVQTPPPLWVGGRSKRSLRRAVEFGNGWSPFGLKPSELAGLLAGFDLPDGFDCVFGTGAVDPQAEPDRARTGLQRMAEAGATIVQVTLQARGPAHYVEQLQAMRDLAAEVMDLDPPSPTAAPDHANDPRTPEENTDEH